MEDEYDAGQVVMRKQREAVGRFQKDYSLVNVDEDGKKKVKWSDSTELREKMKEYRRSQLSICLDYHHIAVEEEREREGVKKWREIKDKQEPEEIDDDTVAAIKQDNSASPQPGKEEEEQGEEGEEGEEHEYLELLPDWNSEDSDDDPYCDEALESRLRVIKAKASRHTILPAYEAGVQMYEEWFDTDSASTASTEQKHQLETYKEIVSLYGQWDADQDGDVIDASYKAIVTKLVEGKKLGEPPQIVSDVMASVLNNEENVRQHKEIYSSMVDSMVTDLSKQIQTTTL